MRRVAGEQVTLLRELIRTVHDWLRSIWEHLMVEGPKPTGASQPSTWHPVVPPRPLSAWERDLVELILSAPMASTTAVPGTAELRRQLPSAKVVEACSCCLSVGITTARNPDDQISGSPTGFFKDLNGTDSDGMVMWAILFLKDGYLSELEVQRADGSPFLQLPDPHLFLGP